MIMKNPPGRRLACAELEQRQYLTKIFSDWTIEGPYHRCACRTSGQTGTKAGSHQLQRLRSFHDQPLSAATC
jgi:hypothetical protein